MILLPAVGCTFIITQSKLFRWLREWVSEKSEFWGEFVSCPMCMGTWVGLLFGLLYGHWYDCFSVSFLSYSASVIIDRIKKR